MRILNVLIINNFYNRLSFFLIHARVITFLNVLFPAGSVTNLGLWALKNKIGASFTVISFGYLIVAIMNFGCLCFHWRQMASAGNAEPQDILLSNSESLFELSARNRCNNEIAADVVINSSSEENEMDEDDSRNQDGDTNHEESLSTPVTSIPSPIAHNHVLISSRPPKKQLTSGLFILLTVSFSIYTARNMFVLSTARDFLAYLGDNDKSNLYLSIFTLLTPASVAVLPLVDIVVTKFNFYGGLQVINIAGLTQGFIQILSKNLNVQVFGFVAFIIYRCFVSSGKCHVHIHIATSLFSTFY